MLETQPGGATFKDTAYGAEGMVQSVTDGNGARTDYAYLDGLLKSKTSTGAGWSHWGVKTEYGYDGEGRLASIADERDVMIQSGTVHVAGPTTNPTAMIPSRAGLPSG